MGYTSWVLSYLVCVRYLISPSIDLRQTYNIQPRRSIGIALIAVYAILHLLLLIAWLRVFQVIWMKLDLVPLGDASKEKEETSTKKFDRYDAFTCDYQGMPIWCDKCHNWKPDRTHHCSELKRCVRKMDHYCPWAGGIIGESSLKFFVQFVFYTSLYCFFTLVVMAFFLAEHVKKVSLPLNPVLNTNKPSPICSLLIYSQVHAVKGTWIAALAVAAFFFAFTLGMTLTTGWGLMVNITTVEQIQKGMVHNIAFLISRTPRDSFSPPSTGTMSKEGGYGLDSKQPWPVLCTVQRSSRRSYVVMQTKPFRTPMVYNIDDGMERHDGNPHYRLVYSYQA